MTAQTKQECADVYSHRIGQRYDERRGGPNGPQVCIVCYKKFVDIINSEVLSVLEEIDKENERCDSGCWVTTRDIKNRYK